MRKLIYTPTFIEYCDDQFTNKGKKFNVGLKIQRS